MKVKEQLDQLREMEIDELRDKADALKESLFRLKFRKTLGVGDALSDVHTAVLIHTCIYILPLCYCLVFLGKSYYESGTLVRQRRLCI